jgi:hypothetical protein
VDAAKRRLTRVGWSRTVNGEADVDSGFFVLFVSFFYLAEVSLSRPGDKKGRTDRSRLALPPVGTNRSSGRMRNQRSAPREG